jgi:hypothetical protein
MEGLAFKAAQEPKRRSKERKVVLTENEFSFTEMSGLVDEEQSGWSFATSKGFPNVEVAAEFVNGMPDKSLYDKFTAVISPDTGEYFVARHAGGKLMSSRRSAA